MMAELRAQADRAAQQALRDLVAYMVSHGGRRHPALEDAYRAAERVLDAVDESARFAEVAAQVADDGAPDYTAEWIEAVATRQYAEGDLRADWGNR